MATLQPNYQPLIKPAAQRLAMRMQNDGSGSTTMTLPAAGTPEWWRDRLFEELCGRRFAYSLFEAYYDGFHRLAFATSKYRETFGNLFSAFADNWCQIVIDSSVERLVVQGFRFGGTGEKADDAAWKLWQQNNLDAEAHLAHTEAGKLGVAYVSVLPNPDDPTEPIIQAEHPSGCIVEMDPANPRRRTAALRAWCDDTEGLEYAVLYRPDWVYWWARPQGSSTRAAGGWQPAPGSGRNELGAVPIVPLVNKPRLRDRRGMSDLQCMVPLQDGVNKLITDMLVASEFASFRQRWATGIEIPKDESGQPIQPFKSAVSRVWAVEDPGVKFGEFDITPLTNYVEASETLVRHIAALTRTPPHYLMGQIVNASGDALKAAEAGLVAKVRAKHVTLGEGWEEVMRLAFGMQHDKTRADAYDAETIWKNPENRTDAELSDAAVKLASIGVPQEELWSFVGYSPMAIQRLKKMRDEEVLITARAAIPLPPGAQDVTAGATPAPSPAGAKPAPRAPGVTPAAPST
jgi:hypothetical protein